MPVDVESELRALGQRYHHEAQSVSPDEVIARAKATGSSVGSTTSRSARRRRMVTLVAAAIIVALGLGGLFVVADRATNDGVPPAAEPPSDDRTTPIVEPTLFPIVGDEPGPNDSGGFSYVAGSNPERAVALVARREGETLVGGLTITASDAGIEETIGAGTSPAEAVGEQVFSVHGRSADVWTEPGDARVQHVRFDGGPSLVIAGVDALAFIQATEPDAITVGVAPESGKNVELSIGALPAPYELIVEPASAPLNAINASIGVGQTQTDEGAYIAVEVADPLPGRAAYGTMTAVDIDGIAGWQTDGPGHYITWQPAPGTYATVGGVSTAGEALALARSVRFVDRATWQAFYDVDDPESARMESAVDDVDPPGTTEETVSTPPTIDDTTGAPGVTSRIQLSSDRVPAGGTLDGFLVIDNTTGGELSLLENGCAPKWNVILVGGPLPELQFFTGSCQTRPLIIPQGESQLPITLRASYPRCSPQEDNDLPTCTSSSDLLPPAPPGDYEAVFVGSLPGIPISTPVPVTVT